MVDRRLGRGLDFFLSGARNAAPKNGPTQAGPAEPGRPGQPAQLEANGEIVQMLALGKLTVNPFQPRKTIDAAELKSLADSIRSSGILQPILARKVGGQLQIVAGERRWRAAKLADLKEVPVIIRQLTDQDSAVFALVENLQREDLNAIEKAQGIKLVMDQTKATQEQVAKQVGFERSTVANFLRLLDLPRAVQAHVSRGTLSMGHARCLLSLPDQKLMVKTAELAIRQGLSVRNLEAKVKELQQAMTGSKATSGGSGKSKRARPVWLNELEESLVDNLSTPVSVRYGRKRSQIIIECSGREEFDRLYERLKNA